MKNLTVSKNVEEFVERLSETPYGSISLKSDGDVSITLEKEFYRKFIERMARIVDIAPRNVANFLQTYYYMRFEVLNLKRILRGKFSGTPIQQIIDSLIPIQAYRTRDFEEMAITEKLEDVVALLSDTPYSSVIDSLELYKEYDALWPLELTLNHTYARTILQSVGRLSRLDGKLVRRIVEFETDIENLLIGVKQRGAPEHIVKVRRLEDLFPSTYGISLDKIREVVESKDIRSVITSLGAPYSDILAPIYEGDVALIRTRLRQYIYQIAKSGRSANDFGFNVVYAYLIFCEMEKDDLIGIAWGKAQGVPNEDILKYLTIPNLT